MMNWISYRELHEEVADFAARLPADLAGVVGVPRSGLMAASLLALFRHVHLSDVETFSRTGKFHTPGSRLATPAPTAGAKVLLLDDSSIRCRAIGSAEKKIRESPRCDGFELLRGAFYVTPEAAVRLDVYHRVVPLPRVFEWNWMAHQNLGRWMCDVDGVLCRDPAVFDDDGPEYEQALRRAEPLYLPRHPVRTLITCRIQRWRSVTRQWLRRHGVIVSELIMHPAHSAEARRRQGGYGHWKGNCYRTSPCTLFIESSAAQAPAIARAAGKPVLCLEDKRIYP
jgi:uncharacterized HAD superfamily protein